jgi:DNA-binding MarR family transcriptional regulator
MTTVVQLTDETASLANLAAALRPFQDLARDTLVIVSVSLVQVFLMIAAKPGQTNSELAKAFDMPHGTVSRILSDLTDVGRSGAPGLGLTVQKPYLYDRRHTRNHLSPKGAALVARIGSALTRLPVARAA